MIVFQLISNPYKFIGNIGVGRPLKNIDLCWASKLPYYFHIFIINIYFSLKMVQSLSSFFQHTFTSSMLDAAVQQCILNISKIIWTKGRSHIWRHASELQKLPMCLIEIQYKSVLHSCIKVTC